MKKGKELKIERFRNYNIVYGSVNNKNPKALYINISAWAEPKMEFETNYHRIIRDIDKKIRQTIFNLLDLNQELPFINGKTIVDFDIRESGVKFGKRSFTNCEITLFMKQALPINSEELMPDIDKLISHIIKTTFESNRSFKFYKKKR